MDIVISKNGVPIRLTEERWEHVTKSHDYMAPYYFEILETVAEPDLIVKGNAGGKLYGKSPNQRVVKGSVKNCPVGLRF